MPSWEMYVQRSAPVLTRLPGEVLSFAGEQESLTLRSLLVQESFRELPLQHLEGVVLTHNRWKAWCEETKKLPDTVPEEVWKQTQHLDQVSALMRINRLFSVLDVVPDVAAWQAGLKIWDGASKVAWKSGSLRIRAKDLQHPRLNQFTDIVNTEEVCADVGSHRWLSCRRGEQEGALRVEFTLPQKRMMQQVEVHREKMVGVVDDRSSESLLQELVLDDIEGWLRYRLKESAEKSMNSNISRTYRLLLEQEPLDAQEVIAIHIGSRRSPSAAVLLNGEGEVINSHVFPPGNNVIHGLKTWVGQFSVKSIVLPIRAAFMQQLQMSIRAFTKTHSIQRVREAGLSAARESWEEQGLETPVASAVILAHRAMFPDREWTRLDPVLYGLGEYQDSLNEDRLRQTLLDEQYLFEIGMERVASQKAPKVTAKTAVTPRELNPLVKSLKDLRPGMTMKGVISNLTNFGAFVQFGLSTEGLVHLSELSERFVSHPSEVVRVGQEVSIRVLSVDESSKRVSLSMRSARPTRDNNKPRRSKPTGSSRAQALRDLENLFKSK